MLKECGEASVEVAGTQLTAMSCASRLGLMMQVGSYVLYNMYVRFEYVHYKFKE